jgi:hypothetical protein
MAPWSPLRLPHDRSLPFSLSQSWAGCSSSNFDPQQIPLLQGTADLVLLALIAWALQRVSSAWARGVIGSLLVGYVSAVPSWSGFLAAVGFHFLRQRMWNVPLLSMLLATFVSTLFMHGLTMLTLRLSDTPFAFAATVNLVTLPSLLLNMILAIPFFVVFGDLANLLQPETLEM